MGNVVMALPKLVYIVLLSFGSGLLFGILHTLIHVVHMREDLYDEGFYLSFKKKKRQHKYKHSKKEDLSKTQIVAFR